tara:strand:- start:8082 stop:8378 length:297 start_codon:yes stop_codon:yes gene_type:complete
MKKIILQTLAIAFLAITFTSCEKCKDCEYKIEWTFISDADTDALYQSMGYDDTQDYYNQLYSNVLPAAEELCDDELEEAESAADVTVPGAYRIYIDCK